MGRPSGKAEVSTGEEVKRLKGLLREKGFQCLIAAIAAFLIGAGLFFYVDRSGSVERAMAFGLVMAVITVLAAGAIIDQA